MEDHVYEFYCRLRETAKGPRTRYQIWEDGEAFEDSVTPSTYCFAYRSHVVLKISTLAQVEHRAFSIGCGNAFVEGDLVSRGCYVQAIDCNAEAIELAAAKGVDAQVRDFFDLPPGHLASFDVVYADGFLGHVYDVATGLGTFFRALDRLAPKPGSWLFLSNDAPLGSGFEVARNEQVSGFWLLSRCFLERELVRHGFQVSESYLFPYERPLSGLRNRSICVARVAGGEPNGEW